MLLPIALSTLATILIVVAVVLLLFLVGGIAGARRRDRRQAGVYAEHVAAADAALEEARAQDKGWDPATMERVAREALAQARPDFAFDALHLVLVDDRPGMTDDRAHFVAVGDSAEARVILTRSEGGDWTAERVE